LSGSLVLALLLAVISSLMTVSFSGFYNEWGAVYRTFASSSMDSYFLVSGKTIATYTPFQLMAHTIAIDTLVFAFLGMTVYTVSLYLPRNVSYLIAIVLAFLPTVEEWCPFSLIYISPCSWMYSNKWRYGQNLKSPSLTFIYVALLLLLLLLGWAGQERIRRVAWQSQEEL
jgi:hypothetical protein